MKTWLKLQLAGLVVCVLAGVAGVTIVEQDHPLVGLGIGVGLSFMIAAALKCKREES